MKTQLRITGKFQMRKGEKFREILKNFVGCLNQEAIVLKNVRMINKFAQNVVIPELMIDEKKALIHTMNYRPGIDANIQMVVDMEGWQHQVAIADKVKKDFTYYWLKFWRFFGFYKNLFNRGDLIHPHKIIETQNFDIYKAISFEPLLSRFNFDWLCETIIEETSPPV